jgi:hypothetical protein
MAPCEPYFDLYLNSIDNDLTDAQQCIKAVVMDMSPLAVLLAIEDLTRTSFSTQLRKTYTQFDSVAAMLEALSDRPAFVENARDELTRQLYLVQQKGEL